MGRRRLSASIQWRRFLISSFVTSFIVLVLYGLVQTLTPASFHVGYPSRPADEVKSLYGFLAAVSILQLMGFCLLYLWVYPQRSLRTAVRWGIWGGFFMVLPDTHFFVDTPNMPWGLLIWQMVTGILAGTAATMLFRMLYRPQDESWTPARVVDARFFVVGAATAAILFAGDLLFHTVIAPKWFAPYPASDFPERPLEEMHGLMPWLFFTYIVHGLYFFYTYLRACPKRGTARAVKYGLWLGIWVLIPNMQFFVGLDKYTWHMLAIQVVEGALLIMLAIVFFELVYRPKPSAVADARAE